jgi:hypothetical protein
MSRWIYHLAAKAVLVEKPNLHRLRNMPDAEDFPAQGKLYWLCRVALLGFGLTLAILSGGKGEAVEIASQGQSALSSAGSETLVDLDIPAQPLLAALFAFSRVTGAQVLVDDAVARDQRSAPLQGVYRREEALQILLAGTGLKPRPIGDTGFTLVHDRSITPEVPIDAELSWASDPLQVTFYTRLQVAVTDALSLKPEARPGNYRAVAQLWFNPDGTVQRAVLLDSTGNRYTDKSIVETLEGLRTGHSLPNNLAQPITFVVLPRGPASR